MQQWVDLRCAQPHWSVAVHIEAEVELYTQHTLCHIHRHKNVPKSAYFKYFIKSDNFYILKPGIPSKGIQGGRIHIQHFLHFYILNYIYIYIYMELVCILFCIFLVFNLLNQGVCIWWEEGCIWVFTAPYVAYYFVYSAYCTNIAYWFSNSIFSIFYILFRILCIPLQKAYSTYSSCAYFTY